MVTDRAYLKGARIGAGLAALDAEVDRLLAALSGSGAARVEPAALQPADLLLDLYGEDIRARAFFTGDEAAQVMLRPDFTVPVTRLHMGAGGGAARYVYCGPVWRRQEFGSERPREYLQAGIEIFGEQDAARSDAEILALITEASAGAELAFTVGDMGLALAAIDALETTSVRRAALLRHIWRPTRFDILLGRYGAHHAQVSAERMALLSAARAGRLDELIAAAGAPVGLRGHDEIAARAAVLLEEADTPPLDPGRVAALRAVLALSGTLPQARAELGAIAAEMPALGPALSRLDARLDAFGARGIDVAALGFATGLGAIAPEYYDGFVFAATAPGRPDLPPIASGGRYDALTAKMGDGRCVPAVGGMIRPEALLAAKGEGAGC